MIIDDLPSISIANDSDEIAIEQGTATKKITKGNFLQEVTSGISSLLTALSGKVSKAGDTMSGNLTVASADPRVYVKNTNMDTTLSSDTANRVTHFGLRDKNDRYIGFIQGGFSTTGLATLAIKSRRRVNGADVDNGFSMRVSNSGVKSVDLDDPAAWRSALGLGEIVYGTNTSGNVSIPSSTATEFSSLTLTTGVWIVVACADWAANGSGYRQIATSDITNPNRSTATTTVGISASGKETYQQLTLIRQITGASSTISFYGLQDSGSSLRIYPYVYATRIG